MRQKLKTYPHFSPFKLWQSFTTVNYEDVLDTIQRSSLTRHIRVYRNFLSFLKKLSDRSSVGFTFWIYFFFINGDRKGKYPELSCTWKIRCVYKSTLLCSPFLNKTYRILKWWNDRKSKFGLTWIFSYFNYKD